MSWLGSLLEIGVDERLSAVDQKHVRTTNLGALIGFLVLAIWGVIAGTAGTIWVGLANELVAALLLVPIALNRACRHREAAAALFGLIVLQLLFAGLAFGAESGAPWFWLMMVGAPYLSFRRRDRWLAHAFSIVFVVAFVVATYEPAFPRRVVMVDLHAQRAVNAVLAATGLALIGAGFIAASDATEDALTAATARADALLLNVLPASIAERLKAHPQRAIADRYEDVTVLFADIVGFTPLSARLPAERTVELLNQVFTEFDRICDAEGIEKVRTIGDGYMAVAGAPKRREDHAEVMVRVALAMRDYMATRPTGEALEIRIGLNSGEAIGAIVGTSRFHFDLWGDAVNVAARMESTGVPGRVQVTEATWRRVSHLVAGEPRGAIEVKGKGPMETWFVG